MIEMPLYSFVAPDIAVFKDNPWKRFARADKADDVMITTGWSDESYAATVEVKKETRLNTIDDLRKTSSVDGVPFSGAMAVERKQAQLLCVRPVMAGEVKPYPEGSLFMHVMTCIDTKTHVYYELTMSEQKIDDRGKVVAPSPKLELATSQFFDSFSVK